MPLTFLSNSVVDSGDAGIALQITSRRESISLFTECRKQPGGESGQDHLQLWREWLVKICEVFTIALS